MDLFYRVLLGIAVLIAAYAFMIRPISDYDYWFHMVSGEYFLSTGNVPDIPLHSWWGIEAGLPWISHEWLFGVFIKGLTDFIGQQWIPDFVALFLGALAAICACFHLQAFKDNFLVTAGGIALVVASLSLGYAPRPQLFAYLLTILMTIILQKDNDAVESKAIYFCIPLMILWVNLHGGSYALLPILLLINLFCNNFNFELGKIHFELCSTKQQIRRLVVLILCLCCIPLNGHGFNMVLYPFTNMADSLMQASISEWKSPDFKNLQMMLPMTLMLLTYCAMISTKKKIKPMDLILCGVFTILFLRSQRFGPQAAPIFYLIMVRYMDGIDFLSILQRKSQILLLVTILAAGLFIGINKRSRINEPFNLSFFPTDEMIELVKDKEPKRLFNLYNDGGYLIYKDVDVFIDGRCDIYSRSNFSDYLSIHGGMSNTLDLIDQYDFDYLLINHDSVLARLLDYQEEYNCILIDAHGKALYERITPLVLEETIQAVRGTR